MRKFILLTIFLLFINLVVHLADARLQQEQHELEEHRQQQQQLRHHHHHNNHQQQHQQQQQHRQHNKLNNNHRTLRQHEHIKTTINGKTVDTEIINNRNNNHNNSRANKTQKFSIINSSGEYGGSVNQWWTKAPETISSRNKNDDVTIDLDNGVSDDGRTLTQNGSNGRHVCTQYKTVQIPVKTTETYRKPTLRHFSEPCDNQQLCTGVRLVHEPAYRDVIRHRTAKQLVYSCCPGWSQVSKTSQGCNKPICQQQCKNGGICAKPDVCHCRPGFTGKYCEIDINECKEDKPCDQMCFNTEGSYYCTCRHGFVLQEDRQSCKKIDTDDTALEARELSNDLDYDELNLRLLKVERLLDADKQKATSTNEMTKKLQYAINSIESMKVQMDTIEHKQHTFNYIADKIKNYETQTKKLEQIVDYLYKCRNNPNYCN